MACLPCDGVMCGSLAGWMDGWMVDGWVSSCLGGCHSSWVCVEVLRLRDSPASFFTSSCLLTICNTECISRTLSAQFNTNFYCTVPNSTLMFTVQCQIQCLLYSAKFNTNVYCTVPNSTLMFTVQCQIQH